MINVSELRTGNLVYLRLGFGQEEVITIEEIRRSDAPLVRYLLNSELTIAYQHDIVGITLTEEWLLKFGFRKDSAPNCYFLGDFIIFTKNESNEISAPYVSIAFKGGVISVPYVHQLQNLCHSLTGGELLLNESL